MLFDTVEYYFASSVYVEKWQIHEFQPHFHSEFEFTLILKGSTECYINHQRLLLRPGDILLVNRNNPHSLFPVSSPCMALWFAVKPSFCNNFYPELSSIRFHDLHITPQHPLNEDLYAHLMEIYHYCYHQDDGYAFKLHEHLNHIFYTLFSTGKYSTLSKSEVNMENRYRRRILQILDYVDKNYSAKPRLEELAVHMELSPDYLSHFVKDALGVTFRDYLNKIRLRHALELLKKPSITQLDLLLQTGFSDYRHFLRTFKRSYGCSPEEYLLNNHNL